MIKKNNSGPYRSYQITVIRCTEQLQTQSGVGILIFSKLSKSGK